MNNLGVIASIIKLLVNAGSLVLFGGNLLEVLVIIVLFLFVVALRCIKITHLSYYRCLTYDTLNVSIVYITSHIQRDDHCFLISYVTLVHMSKMLVTYVSTLIAVS